MTTISRERIAQIEARRDELQALMATGDLPSIVRRGVQGICRARTRRGGGGAKCGGCAPNWTCSSLADDETRAIPTMNAPDGGARNST